MPPIKKDANAILYELITTLSTYKEHNERDGHDLARDEKFTAAVIEKAKELNETNQAPLLIAPVMTVTQMKSYAEDLVNTYTEYLHYFETNYSNEKKEAYFADPRVKAFPWNGATRKECLINQWNKQKTGCEESVKRKKKRMEDARAHYEAELARLGMRDI